MKVLFQFIILNFFLSMLALAEPLPAIKIEGYYEGENKKWFSKIIGQKPKGKITFPSLILRDNEEAKIEILKNYVSLAKKGNESSTPCGMTWTTTAEIVSNSVVFNSSMIFKRPLDDQGDGVATQFETEEVIINKLVENGKTVKIPLMKGGNIFITATIIDTNGTPLLNLVDN